MDGERLRLVRNLVSGYVRSPSIRHLRDPHSLDELALQIVRQLDGGNSMWTKWERQRDLLIKMAVGCWVPIEGLRAALNNMAGAPLTATDVEQRLSALEEELGTYPNDELRAGCLAIYEKERADGTEVAAIVGLLRSHIKEEESHLQHEREERYRAYRDQKLEERRARLMSGADVGWTRLPGSRAWYCRANGRTYRVAPTITKRWILDRVAELSDTSEGRYIGEYSGRRDASVAISTVAYRPDLGPRQ